MAALYAGAKQYRRAGYEQAALRSNLRWHVADRANLTDCGFCCCLSKGTMLAVMLTQPCPHELASSL